MRLENKVALISGGARGIGAAVTRAFAREGAKIVIGDVLEDEGRRTAEEVTAAGGECYFVNWMSLAKLIGPELPTRLQHASASWISW